HALVFREHYIIWKNLGLFVGLASVGRLEQAYERLKVGCYAAPIGIVPVDNAGLFGVLPEVEAKGVVLPVSAKAYNLREISNVWDEAGFIGGVRVSLEGFFRALRSKPLRHLGGFVSDRLHVLIQVQLGLPTVPVGIEFSFEFPERHLVFAQDPHERGW